jgi:hypothetical protein
MDRTRGPPSEVELDTDAIQREDAPVTLGQDWHELDWHRLATYVTNQRQVCGYPTVRAFAPATSLNEKTLYRIERAEQPVSPNTLATLERALGWAPGDAVAILKGGEPRVPAGAERAASVAKAQAEILRMTAEQLTNVYNLVRAVSGQEAGDSWLQGAYELQQAARPVSTGTGTGTGTGTV